MSHIFDGLQRSEAEYSGAETESPLRATLLLQNAERRAVSQWESKVTTGQVAATMISDVDSSFATAEAVPVVSRLETPGSSEPLRPIKPLSLFDQFKAVEKPIPSQTRLPCLTDNGSPAAEAFRLLAVRLGHLRQKNKLKRVLITSTIPLEGKSTIAANLACTLALKTQHRVLLLEGDLRHPSLSPMFEMNGNPGLCEFLEKDNSLAASIYRLVASRIWILPAGNTSGNPLELLQSAKLATLMDQLDRLFDWIIIDSPPVLPLADTSVWMRLADGILLTTRQGITEKRQLQRGLEAVDSNKLIGALANSSEHAATSSYYTYGPNTAS